MDVKLSSHTTLPEIQPTDVLQAKLESVIPDDIKYKMAIEYYLMERIAFKLYLQDRIYRYAAILDLPIHVTWALYSFISTAEGTMSQNGTFYDVNYIYGLK